jgi:5'-nucleotidase
MHIVRVLLAFIVAVCTVTPPLRAQQPPPYRILISNDDGVRAPGLAAVAQILQAIGNVIVIAPSENQSAKGHALTTRDAIVREELTLPNGLKAIGLSATPATTVKVALKNILKPAPDLVVSGINRGYNLGLSAYISGTVGAAREAAMAGIPAVAASLTSSTNDYSHAAEAVLGVARRVKQYGLPPNTFLNVNIPAGEPKGFAVTSQAMRSGGSESFSEAKDEAGRTVAYFDVYKEGGGGPAGTDMWAVEQGLVAVTPMTVGEFEPALPDKIKAWFK